MSILLSSRPAPISSMSSLVPSARPVRIRSQDVAANPQPRIAPASDDMAGWEFEDPAFFDIISEKNLVRENLPTCAHYVNPLFNKSHHSRAALAEKFDSARRPDPGDQHRAGGNPSLCAACPPHEL
jgi:hypothetical protein